MAILQRIESPDDIKKLSYGELKELAVELREYIIKVVSTTGGHLAPSLGVVELTIALLRVFDPPYDRIVWDVGHQCYPYKILTGRRDSFPTIRTYGGLSGFPRRDESDYDSLGVGHASTSISAALGFSVARDLCEERRSVVAVIGDGALTGGLVYEALNNAGVQKRDLLVILNDNKMSISRNVGAMSHYLTDIIADPRFEKLKGEIWGLLGKLYMGDRLRGIAARVEDSLKNLLVPGMLFEQLGFDYYGPVDGHNIKELESVLGDIKGIKKPRLLHIITKKGKGYVPAERDASHFHGVGAFDRETGSLSGKKKLTYTTVFGDAMVELGYRYPRLVAVTAAMEIGTGLSEFHKKFPSRLFDVGIAEEHGTLFGVALALEGIPTVVAIYSTFMQRAYDQLIHDAALQKAPVVIAMDRGGIVGDDGPTHHGVFDLSYLRCIPNMVVAAPADGKELRDMLLTAIEYRDGPFALRYPRGAVPPMERSEPMEKIPIGSWEIRRAGDGEVVVLAVGRMVQNAMDAADTLDDADITVVDARFIKPMDETMLSKLLPDANLLVTIEENVLIGGFGEGVVDWAAKRKLLPPRLLHIGIPDEFVPHGDIPRLFEDLGLSPSRIAERIEEALGKSDE